MLGDPVKQENTTPNRELLAQEFAAAMASYDSRDSLVFNEFLSCIAIVGGLTAVLTLTQPLSAAWYYPFVQALVGVAGVLSLLAIALDMEATQGTKTALRLRMKAIEPLVGFSLWTGGLSPDERRRFLFERAFRPTGIRLVHSVNFYLLASKMLLLLWAFAVVLLIWGNGWAVIFFVVCSTLACLTPLAVNYRAAKLASK